MLIFPNTAWLVPPSYAKRIHSLMAALKETPKKLAFASNSNKESFRGNSCRLCKCDLKYKLVILHGTYLLKIFLIPLARKVLKKRLWISLFTNTWVLPSSKLRNTRAEFAIMFREGKYKPPTTNSDCRSRRRSEYRRNQRATTLEENVEISVLC